MVKKSKVFISTHPERYGIENYDVVVVDQRKSKKKPKLYPAQTYPVAVRIAKQVEKM